MTDGLLRPLDRGVRSIAYDILCRRDGFSGWKSHRQAFLLTTRKKGDSLAQDVEKYLKRILNHAYETCPYYKEIWNSIGFHPSSTFVLNDLEFLPFLTKGIIKEKKSRLLSESYRESDLDLSYTGGTTGTQTSFYRNHDCSVSRFGRQWGMLEMCGYKPGMRRGLVWGVHDDLPAAVASRSLKQLFRHYASGDITLGCAVMSEPLMTSYHQQILRFRPDILYGYPSALLQLARFIEAEGLKPVKVDTLITTAERLSESNRKELMRMFCGEVFNLYCTREYGCIGFECSRHNGFHVDTGSVYLEIIKDGKPAEPGESGEIVISDLLNFGMPFIRSRTGDIGALSSEPCNCGCSLPLLKALDGRSTDLIYRPDGSVVPGLLLTDLFIDIQSIQYLQFVQERIDQLNVLLVVNETFSGEVLAEVERQVRELVGEQIIVQVRLVDEIKRNPRSGKIREVISKIDPDELALRREAVKGKNRGTTASEG